MACGSSFKAFQDNRLIHGDDVASFAAMLIQEAKLGNHIFALRPLDNVALMEDKNNDDISETPKNVLPARSVVSEAYIYHFVALCRRSWHSRRAASSTLANGEFHINGHYSMPYTFAYRESRCVENAVAAYG